MLRLSVAATALFLLSSVACADFNTCSNQINQKFLPTDTAIAVGEQFTAQVLVTTCDGRQILSSLPTWHSQDPSVASVDSSTGRVTGNTLGETLISATGSFYSIKGSIHVQVR
jgi:hypothetical protein